jgi:hypothetical protein
MSSGTLRQHGSVWVSLALATLLTACFTVPARAETETRTMAPFHAIAFQGSWTVEVTVGKEQSVILEGDKAVLAHVKSEVVDGQLRLGVEDDHRSFFEHFDVGHLTARITVPSLTAFALHGSGKAHVVGFSGGAAAFALDGSGDLSADGHVDTLALVVNGSGTADFSGLVSGKASTTINGSGDIKVRPNESLAAVVNGSGQVTYIGDSAKVTSVVHGSGAVEKQ